MGIDEDFTRADRWVTGGIFWWSMFWFVVFALGSVMYLVRPWSDQVWAHYWGISMVFLPLAIGVATTVWFTIGGLRDLRIFFRRLRAETLEINAGGYGAATELVAERCANVEAVTSKRANHEVC